MNKANAVIGIFSAIDNLSTVLAVAISNNIRRFGFILQPKTGSIPNLQKYHRYSSKAL